MSFVARVMKRTPERPEAEVWCSAGDCREGRFGHIITDAGPENRWFVLDPDWHKVEEVWTRSARRARAGKTLSIVGARTAPPRYPPAVGDRLRCPRCCAVNVWPGAQGVRS